MDMLCVHFLNSDWRDWRGSGRSDDRLLRPEWLAAFMEKWGFQDLGQPGPEELEALLALRALLRRVVVRAAGGEPPAGDDLAELNRVLGGASVMRQAEISNGAFRLQSVPAVRDWAWAASEIAASLVGLLAMDPQRIKICDNPDCGWVFWDESRNRTRRWCDDQVCGNLLKVRRFRARQKSEQ